MDKPDFLAIRDLGDDARTISQFGSPSFDFSIWQPLGRARRQKVGVRMIRNLVCYFRLNTHT